VKNKILSAQKLKFKYYMQIDLIAEGDFLIALPCACGLRYVRVQEQILDKLARAYNYFHSFPRSLLAIVRCCPHAYTRAGWAVSFGL